MPVPQVAQQHLRKPSDFPISVECVGKEETSDLGDLWRLWQGVRLGARWGLLP